MSRVGKVTGAASTKADVRVMMDSGAFSAWSRGITIDLDEYIDYLKKNAKHFYSAVCLDTIPGKNGSMERVNARQLEESANKSFANYIKMRDNGLDVIPVFHQGEDFSHLEKLVKERVPYIGISPYMRASANAMRMWFDECFTRISDKDGVPVVKTHGFGITSHWAVVRYPWFTIDSTSWIMAAAYGRIMMPIIDGDHRRFDLPPVMFAVSDRENVIDGAKALLNVGPYTKRIIKAYLSEIELDIPALCLSQNARAEVNLAYFKGVQQELTVKPFQYRVRNSAARKSSEIVVPFDYSPEFFFAMTLRSNQAVSLNRIGMANRLVSYFDCKKMTGAEIVDAHSATKYVEYRKWGAEYKRKRHLDFHRRFPNNEYKFNGVEE